MRQANSIYSHLPPARWQNYLFRSAAKIAPVVSALLSAVVLPLPGITQTAPTSSFPDATDHWAASCIEGVGTQGLMSGYLDGRFLPEGTMSRAEFAAVMVKAFPNAPVVRAAPSFVDVPQDFWGAGAIAAAYERGFLVGYPNNQFRPEENISRIQAIVIIANAQQLAPISANESILARYFDDNSAVPNYAKGLLAAATNQKLVVNYPELRQLRPNENILRGEATALLCRAGETIEGESVADARFYVPAEYVVAFDGQSTAGIANVPVPELLRAFPKEFSGLLYQRRVLGEQLFFLVQNEQGVPELWKSDGTENGTQQVRQLVDGTSQDAASNAVSSVEFVNNDEQLLWIEARQSIGFERYSNRLWVSDGTASGTRPIAPLNPELKQILDNPEHTLRAFPTTIFNSRLPFVVSTQNDTQLWITDGISAAGTERIATFPGTQTGGGGGLQPDNFAATDQYLFFTAAAANDETALWRTDGTAANTLPLQTIADPYASISIQAVGNRLYFTATTSRDDGAELWTSDGTVAGTLRLKDIYPGENSALVNPFTQLTTPSGTTLFALANSPDGRELWTSQGTPESTQLIKRLNELPLSTGTVLYTPYGNNLLFAVSASETLPHEAGGEGPFELWMSDGTPVGTQLTGGRINSFFPDFTLFKDQIFFNGSGPDGEELSVTDGTPEGTRQVLDLTPGTTTYEGNCPTRLPGFGEEAVACPRIVVPKGSGVRSLTVIGDSLYFIANNTLFRTDGTGKGIQQIQQLGDEAVFYSPEIVQLGERLLLIGYPDINSQQPHLWVLSEN